MVTFIQTWGIALISAAMIGAICKIMLPKHSISKVAQIVIGLYLILTMIAPFLHADIEIPDSIEFSYETSLAQTQVFDDAVLSQSKQFLQQEIAENLRRKEVEVDEISVSVNIDAAGSIYCDEIDITLDQIYIDRDVAIKEWVSSLVGLEPELTYG
jgi:hypothetical protein